MDGQLDVDEIWNSLGVSGKFHKIQMALILINVIPSPLHLLASVFVAYRPPHVCNETDVDSMFGDDVDSYRNSTYKFIYNKCSIDVYTNDTNSTLIRSTGCISGHKYPISPDRTLVTEWGLVCKGAELSEFSQTLLIVGQAIGASVFASLADKFGRKPIHVFGNISLFVISFSIAWSPNYTTFAILRFLLGAVHQGSSLTMVILCIELLPLKIRFYGECLALVFWSTGGTILALFGYIFRDLSWRYLQMALAFFSAYSLVEWWIIEESVRWLLANGKIREAERIVMKAAKMNKKNFDEVIRAATIISTGTVCVGSFTGNPKVIIGDENLDGNPKVTISDGRLAGNPKATIGDGNISGNSMDTIGDENLAGDQTDTIGDESIADNPRDTIGDENIVCNPNHTIGDANFVGNPKGTTGDGSIAGNPRDTIDDRNMSGNLKDTIGDGEIAEDLETNLCREKISVDTNNKILAEFHVLSKSLEQVDTEQNVAEESRKISIVAPLRKYNALTIFRHKRVFFISLILWYTWMVNSLVYYALSLTSSALSGNRFLNFFLLSIVEYPAALMEYMLLNRIGRRKSSIWLHAIAGIALAVSTLCHSFSNGSKALNITSLIFNLIGKFGITATFSILFLYTPEMYPTNMRNAGIGLCSTVARLGGMVAPFAGPLAERVSWGPGAISAGMCLLVVYLLTFLPETKGYELPTTIEELEQWYKEHAGDKKPKPI